MRIINLIEDTAGQRGLHFEHGLSFYIEACGHKILLDTGATGKFIENASLKNIDLSKVDTVILSHGHYDHTGGVLAFSEINRNARIYINENALGEFFNCREEAPKYIGMDEKIKKLPQAVFTKGNFKIDKGISVFTGAISNRPTPRGNKILKKKVENTFIEDDFSHEQYLVVEENGLSVLLSGCAHRGILNILDKYREIYEKNPTHVVSGFHTTKKEYTSEDISLIEQTAKELSNTETLFFTGHCTGEYPLEILKKTLKNKLTVLHSGNDVIF